MENKTVLELITEALQEAKILETGLDEYNEDRMLFMAQRLSGAPYSFVENVYRDQISY